MTVSSRPRRHLGSRAVGHVQTLYAIRSRLTAARATGMTWRKIAEFFPGVPAATLCAIAKHNRDPKSPAIRSALGLPAYASAPVCPVHGVVHQGRCPRKTFEQRAADYDAWKTRNMPKLLAIVAWAEGARR